MGTKLPSRQGPVAAGEAGWDAAADAALPQQQALLGTLGALLLA